jgi:hypothetical protein
VQRLDTPVPTVAGPRDLLRRLTRWFNLTVLHQVLWPVIVILSGATMPEIADASAGDLAGMILCPLAACVVAVIYLRGKVWSLPSPSVTSAVAEQARLIAIGLPAMVLIGRLIAGDIDATLRIAAVGAVSVAAYHLIHFGVVRAIFGSPIVPVVLFGLSWAIHDLATALAQDAAVGSHLFRAIGGFSAGLLVAIASVAVHRWPGGRLTSPSLHWLVVYLIFGFTR